MISEFRIISITEKGRECLQNNINEFSKLPPHAKLMWKAFFTREVLQNPLSLVVKVKSSNLSNMLDPDDLIKKLHSSMMDEGAKKDVDYKIEVKRK